MISEAIAKLKQLQDRDNGVNTQQVFERLPKAQTKERQKVDFNALFSETAKRLCKSTYEENNVIETLKMHFLQVSDFDKYKLVKNEPNIFKGLLVFGDYGVGKSMFFEIMHEIGKELVLKHGYQGLHFSKLSCPWIVEEYMRATEKGYAGNFSLPSYYKGKLYLDDLGAERLAFGRDNIIADLLFERHRNGAMTYITTNLKPSELAEKYGARIGDRLAEGYNILNWSGNSYRHKK